jgi:NAD-dependent dihydropyrimidine dehydrogenase PreA subunit
MVYIDSDRCTGCGVCVDACPTGAIRLADGIAAIEQSLCQECQDCLEACPNRAILAVSEPAPVVREPTLPEVVRVAPPLAPSPQSPQVLPALAGALTFVGREVVPRLATWLLDAWSQRQQAMPGPSPANKAMTPTFTRRAGGGGRGQQRRVRRRGR